MGIVHMWGLSCGGYSYIWTAWVVSELQRKVKLWVPRRQYGRDHLSHYVCYLVISSLGALRTVCLVYLGHDPGRSWESCVCRKALCTKS